MSLIDLPNFVFDIIDEFSKRQTSHINLPILQPADLFLNIAGEELRRRIFLIENKAGKSLCLRPEFTIPGCLHHIKTSSKDSHRYWYLGKVFRQRHEDTTEFYQAGIEDLGEKNIAAADARSLTDVVAILSKILPNLPIKVTIGDQKIFREVLQSLGLPSSWQNRLINAFGNKTRIASLLEDLSKPQPKKDIDQKIVNWLLTNNEAALVSHLTETMYAMGYSINVSRSPIEIAKRLKEKYILSQIRLDSETIKLLESFLSINVPLKKGALALKDFSQRSGLNLETAIFILNERASMLEDAGIDLHNIFYCASFGHQTVNYYTSLIFNITTQTDNIVLANGGRFDQLLTLLGEKHIYQE